MQLTAAEVLRTFHRDEIALFLGSAFATVGLISFGVLLIRRRYDALLFWLAVFAILYGARLWMQSRLLALMVPPSEFFNRLRAFSDFIVAIPALFFFRAAGFLGRFGNVVAYPFGGVMMVLALLAFLGAPIPRLHQVNNFVVIAGLLAVVFQSLRPVGNMKDFRVIRNGLFIFIAFALWNNALGLMGKQTRVEPYGFAVFLGCLGYVAVRRAIERDQQWTEIQKELDVARRIQRSILPGAFPLTASFRGAARYLPMNSVAGDFYDFVLVDERRLGLLIADVSGHGVPAALIASMVKLAASSQRAAADRPHDLLAAMNVTLCGNTQTQFVTAAYVQLDAERGELRYSAAAHPPMLLLRGREVISIEENGLMLALFPKATYTCTVRTLEPGDRVVLYTDGIVEAADTKDEPFGCERLSHLIRTTSDCSHEEAADRIIASVQGWAAAQEDDLTVIVCDYLGAPVNAADEATGSISREAVPAVN
ncbi:MAG: PP2C family protein-serine/threonine phosphatase [Acidobacteriaceae bacterium]|nr:PP2C family protein-serine/threonine phosphatase [Acidobacteriaceae bacterium]